MSDERCGLLSGEEIETHGLIIDAEERLYRAATYDLSVGEIIPAGPEAASGAASSEYRLPPGGMVRVVSRESLRLPGGITGHVLLKNELCRTAVLAINIGVVDPGFVGPLSSTLINFGRAEFLVKRGQPFLRVSFHRCPLSAKAADAAKWERGKYLERAREEVLAYSASTFLNVEQTAAKAAEKAFGSFTRSLLLWATVAAVVLALATIFVPLGASYVDRYLAGRERREADAQQSFQRQFDEQRARVKDLSDQIKELRRSAAVRAVGRGAPSGRQ
jgi:deoxycytidine triphosphate deaminase